MEQEPQSVVKAMNSIEKEKWTEAMKKEMDSIYSNDVWDLVKPLKDHKVIGSKWVSGFDTAGRGEGNPGISLPP